MSLLDYVRMSAPEAPIVLLVLRARRAADPARGREGAQDCLIKAELGPARAPAGADPRDRAQTRGGGTRPPGAARPAHRAPQPRPVPRPPRRRPRALPPLRRPARRAVPRLRQLQGDQRLAAAIAAGDRVLATLGERLSGLLRPMDTVARFGGDEFTFLFEGISIRARGRADRRPHLPGGRPRDRGGGHRACGSRSRWASRWSATRRSRPRRSSARPMPRCTGPRIAGARASSCSTRTRGGGPASGWSSRRRSSRRSSGASCACTTSPI